MIDICLSVDLPVPTVPIEAANRHMYQFLQYHMCRRQAERQIREMIGNDHDADDDNNVIGKPVGVSLFESLIGQANLTNPLELMQFYDQLLQTCREEWMKECKTTVAGQLDHGIDVLEQRREDGYDVGGPLRGFRLQNIERDLGLSQLFSSCIWQ